MKTLELKPKEIPSPMDCSEPGIVMFDENAYCQSWNAYMKNLFGKSPEEVLGKKIFDIVPFNKSEFKKEIIKSLHGESVRLKLFLSDAEEKEYLNVELFPLFKDPSKIVGGMCLIRKYLLNDLPASPTVEFEDKTHESFDELISPNDIAYTLKKTLTQLNESERIADMGSWDWESANEWMTWSENLFKIFGYTNYPKTISGSDFFSHLLPEDRLYVADAVKKLSEHMEPFDIEHRVLRKDGEIIWIYCKGRVLESKDGKSVRMIGVAHDITRQKMLEAALKKTNDELEERVKKRTEELFISEERFRLVSRATNDAIWDWDVKNDKLWWNGSFKTLFGYPEKEKDFGFGEWSSKIHPEDREQAMNIIHNVIQNSISSWSSEYRFLKYDGNYSYILDRGYGLYDENGKPYRMVGSMVDLTALKETQEKLERSNEILKRINTDLDNFIYTASHDLKAPISNLEGLLLALKDYPIDGEVKDLIAMMEYSTERLKKTILDLTEITKAQRESSELEEISIKEVYQEVFNSLKPEIYKCNATISFEIGGDEKIYFSRKDLKSLLWNLLSNAIKYSSPLRKPEIKVYSERNENLLAIHIEDNGLGLNENQIGKLFSMFKRLHTHVEGSGIGLYIVKRIMENYGGRVAVRSKEGEGSCFSLYFQLNSENTCKSKDCILKSL